MSDEPSRESGGACDANAALEYAREEIASTNRLIDETREKLAVAERRQLDASYHPHYRIWVAGGDAWACGLRGEHIPALAGLLGSGRDPFLRLIARAAGLGDVDYLLKLIPAAIAFGPADLDERGIEALGDAGMLHKRRLPDRWQREPKFGLGQPFAMWDYEVSARFAWQGLWTLPIAEFAKMLEGLPRSVGDVPAGKLMHDAVERHFDYLDARGGDVAEDRREAKYHARARNWALQPDQVKNGAWRKAPLKRRQGLLMTRTALFHEIDLPGEIDRGEAADWLDRHGANIRYRIIDRRNG